MLWKVQECMLPSTLLLWAPSAHPLPTVIPLASFHLHIPSYITKSELIITWLQSRLPTHFSTFLILSIFSCPFIMQFIES